MSRKPPSWQKLAYQQYAAKIAEEDPDIDLPIHEKFGQPEDILRIVTDIHPAIPTYNDLIRAILFHRSRKRLSKGSKVNESIQELSDYLAEKLNLYLRGMHRRGEIKSFHPKQKLKIAIKRSYDMLMDWGKNKKLKKASERILHTSPPIVTPNDTDDADEILDEEISNEMNIDNEQDVEQTSEEFPLSDTIDATEMEGTSEEDHDFPEYVSSQESNSSQGTSEWFTSPESQSDQPNSGTEWEQSTTPESSPSKNTRLQLKRKKTYLKETSEACDRTGVPLRQAALIINAYNTDTQNPARISEKKLRLSTKRSRDEKIVSQSGLVITCLGIDGKKNKNLTSKTVTVPGEGNSFKRTTHVSTNNITIVSGPEEQYIGHYTTVDGTGESMFDGFVVFADSRGIVFIETLEALNLDGTGTNTGPDNGFATRLENYIERPLQWNVCFLHHLERPWMHLFTFLDGKTYGPDCFSGPIGKAMAGPVEDLPVINFEKIEVSNVSTQIVSLHDLSCFV